MPWALVAEARPDRTMIRCLGKSNADGKATRTSGSVSSARPTGYVEVCIMEGGECRNKHEHGKPSLGDQGLKLSISVQGCPHAWGARGQ